VADPSVVTLSRLQRPALLLSASALAYGAVFGAYVLFERPGLGIGHFYYLAIVLVALVTGPRTGAIGGVAATALYGIGVFINPRIPSIVGWESTSIRLVTYVAIGVIVGWYAASKRDLLVELTNLAERDDLTGLPNTRGFEAAIERRFGHASPFVLMVGDVDELGQLNERLGRNQGDEALRRVADVLARTKHPGDEVARIGDDEFAILARLEGADGRTLALELERLLATPGTTMTFGWATYPRDGRNALALYRAADERLYARKLARGFRRGSLELAVLPTRA
jgi:diguanylate cyclase (GGDEF)-like protein